MTAFLLERERAYCGASFFYEKLAKLGIRPDLYVLPPHYVFEPEELFYFAQSILNDLRNAPQNEDREYATNICERLKDWSEKQYIVHVIS